MERLAEPQSVRITSPALEACFAACQDPSLRSDIVRYEVLSIWGGVWVDFDVACLRPLDSLCQYSGFAGSESFGLIGSAVLGAPKGSPVVLRARELIPSFLDMEDRLSIGPRLLTRSILDRGSSWTILEPEAFYAWRWGASVDDCCREGLGEAFALHLNHSLGRVSVDHLGSLLPEFAGSVTAADADGTSSAADRTRS